MTNNFNIFIKWFTFLIEGQRIIKKSQAITQELLSHHNSSIYYKTVNLARLNHQITGLITVCSLMSNRQISSLTSGSGPNLGATSQATQGGTHIVRWYGDVLPSRYPFFGSHFSSGDPHLFKPFSSSRDPLQFFWKKLASQDQVLLILTKFSAPETLILAKNCSGDPSFKQKKKKFQRPYF